MIVAREEREREEGEGGEREGYPQRVSSRWKLQFAAVILDKWCHFFFSPRGADLCRSTKDSEYNDLPPGV